MTVHAPPEPVNKWLVAISVTFGTLMGTIDASIINVAIPHLQAGVGATVEQITWVATGFAIATVIVMPLTAFLARFFGQKRIYLAALGIFIAGSMLCGLARSLETLVAFRVLQGFGAGALQPTEQAILRQTFPPREQGMAMAVFSLAVMIGPALGPTIGGFIVDNWSWPWIFYINLPVGLLGILMVWRFVHEPEDVTRANREMAEHQRRNLDWAGIVLLSVGLACLQYVLEEGNRDDWFQSALITGMTVTSVFALAAFTIRELTAKMPAVDLRLFSDPVFLSGTLITSVMFVILFAVTFLLPLFMQTLLGFTAMQAGLALMPRTLIMFITTPIVGRLYNHVSPRLVVGFGIVAFAIGAWQMSTFTLDTGTFDIVVSLLVQGLGFSCLFVPLAAVSLSSVARPRLTDAAGLNSLLRQIGGSIGLAIFATFLTRDATTARWALISDVTAGRPEVISRLAGLQTVLQQRGMDPAGAQAASLAMLDMTTRRQAMLLSFEHLFLLTGILFLCALPLLFFLKSEHHGPSAKAGPDMHVEM